jgi:hypothetical protein
MPGTAGGADAAYDGEYHVLRGDTGRQCAVDVDAHAPGFLLPQALCRQDVLHLRRADAESEGGESTVGVRVRVPADDRHAGQREPLLGTDDVDDALAGVVHVELLDAVAGAVLVQGINLEPRYRVRDAVGAIGGGHVVIGHRDVGVAPPGLPAGERQTFEGLGRGDLVHEMPIDVDQAVAILIFMNDVGIPEFVIKGFSGHSQSFDNSARMGAGMHRMT